MSETINDLAQAAEISDHMRAQIGRAIIGQSQVIQEVLIAFLAAGHVLIEGVPGLGKTLLARALAKTFEGKFARIQFTPDLMPNDITGHVIYDQNTYQFLEMNDLTSGLIKAAVFGTILSLTGCTKGFYTTGGAEGVGRATTEAVVMSSLVILLSDFFLTKLLF